MTLSDVYLRYTATHWEWVRKRFFKDITEHEEDEYAHVLEHLWWELTDEEQIRFREEKRAAEYLQTNQELLPFVDQQVETGESVSPRIKSTNDLLIVG